MDFGFDWVILLNVDKNAEKIFGQVYVRYLILSEAFKHFYLKFFCIFCKIVCKNLGNFTKIFVKMLHFFCKNASQKIQILVKMPQFFTKIFVKMLRQIYKKVCTLFVKSAFLFKVVKTSITITIFTNFRFAKMCKRDKFHFFAALKMKYVLGRFAP